MDKQQLIQAAKQAAANAYAPYSGFAVGAAVLTNDGKVFTGANVENISYGLTVCAERIAIFKAVTDGAPDIAAIAIAADVPEPPRPCGACLQVMAEFAGDLVILMAGADSVDERRLIDLLPDPFRTELP